MDHTKTAMKEKRREEEKGREVWAQKFRARYLAAARREDGLMGLIAVQMLRLLARVLFAPSAKERKKREKRRRQISKERAEEKVRKLKIEECRLKNKKERGNEKD